MVLNSTVETRPYALREPEVGQVKELLSIALLAMVPPPQLQHATLAVWNMLSK